MITASNVVSWSRKIRYGHREGGQTWFTISRPKVLNSHMEFSYIVDSARILVNYMQRYRTPEDIS